LRVVLSLVGMAVLAGHAWAGTGDGRTVPATAAPVDASDARTAAGVLYVEPPTLHSLGFQWHISGDSDRDGRVGVRYRGQVTSMTPRAAVVRYVPGSETPRRRPEPNHIKSGIEAAGSRMVLFRRWWSI